MVGEDGQHLRLDHENEDRGEKDKSLEEGEKEGVEELLPLAAEESVGALAEHKVKTGYKHGEELAGEEEEGEQTEGP